MNQVEDHVRFCALQEFLNGANVTRATKTIRSLFGTAAVNETQCRYLFTKFRTCSRIHKRSDPLRTVLERQTTKRLAEKLCRSDTKIFDNLKLLRKVLRKNVCEVSYGFVQGCVVRWLCFVSGISYETCSAHDALLSRTRNGGKYFTYYQIPGLLYPL